MGRSISTDPSKFLVGSLPLKVIWNTVHGHLIRFGWIYKISLCFAFQLKEDEKAGVTEFFKNCYYVKGPYNEESGFKKLNAELNKLGEGKDQVNRLFYLALPPSVFMDASENIKKYCMGSKYVYSRIPVMSPPHPPPPCPHPRPPIMVIGPSTCKQKRYSSYGSFPDISPPTYRPTGL